MYKLILSFRYLFKKRISYLALLAVSLCVFIVVVVMTIMTGLVSDFKQKNHNFTGDCIISTESLVGFPYYEDFITILEQTDFITGVSPVIRNFGLISRSGTDKNWPIKIEGIDPIRHSRATAFAKTLHYHKDNVSTTFQPTINRDFPGFVLGIDLALEPDDRGRYTFSPTPNEFPFTITTIPLTAKGAPAKAGTTITNSKVFYTNDYSHSGLARVDSLVVYLPFEDAQLLCGMAGTKKRANAIHVKFKPGVEIENGCSKIAHLWQQFIEDNADADKANLLKTVTVQSWKTNRRQFIAAMEKEQTMMAAMFAIVGLTTFFIILVIFYMIISHKTKDIGILKSLGASGAGIIQLFSLFAFCMGALASAIGALSGWLFLVLFKINCIEDWLLEKLDFQLLYAIRDIPNTVDLKVLSIIIISAITACLIGALIPAWRASQLKPVESLQVNQL